MDEITMISGIKRKTTAIESTFRFFQTVDLIISHFKREADKIKIFELTSKDTTFKDLLIATATIHIYHNLGVKVQNTIDSNKFTFDSTKNLEVSEKAILTEELGSLLKNSFLLEASLLKKEIDLENKFISFLIEVRKEDLQEIQRDKMIKEIETQIEQELQEIIRNYPSFYFYDLIGDLIGLNNEIKLDILEESSAFKEVSVDIEKKLKLEEKEDKFIELATLDRMINKIRNDFEFKSYKELQVEAMPVRMIKRRVVDFNFECFPISIPGLSTFEKANNIKKEIIDKIEEALYQKINYEQFENELLLYLKSELIKKLKENPNDFIYYLQCLNESSFDEIIYNLNKYGVNNILHLSNLDYEVSEEVKRNMIRYNIKKVDITALNDLKSNQGYSKKKQIIDKVFLNELKLKNYSHILFILDFEDILNKIVKDIFFYILSKFLRQLSRIIELYSKVSNDRSLLLLALKKIDGTMDSEEWVRIKLEELIIKRLNKRQEELVIVLNASNQPFLVNGFILARLTENSLKDGIFQLKNNDSMVYENIASLTLKSDLISPISYCIGYDIVKRLEKIEHDRKEDVTQKIEAKEKEKQVQAKKIREKQELSTLNWIERRITSSLMRINSPGINPNQLYWQEKDSKTATENIKLHSELKGDSIDLICQFFNFAVEKIKSFDPKINLPTVENIRREVSEISANVLSKRVNDPKSLKDKPDLLDGERYEISSNIAKKIGKLLDKALYSKFKKK
ncbi:MAG: hypothetical protein KGD58_01465 [Candidatus Lokiarchaeota archaeon]|nr:hypothetical protein [Candidatus Lokiarchaeota archaeon]